MILYAVKVTVFKKSRVTASYWQKKEIVRKKSRKAGVIEIKLSMKFRRLIRRWKLKRSDAWTLRLHFVGFINSASQKSSNVDVFSRV